MALWAGAIFIALKIRVPRGAARDRSYAVDETLIVLPADGDDPGRPVVPPSGGPTEVAP